MDKQTETFDSWAVLEVMGHRRLAGKVTEQLIAGMPFLRIDVPMDGDQMTTQFYAPSSVYCLTPTTEEIARAVARRNQPEPVFRWELPSPQAHRQVNDPDEDDPPM